MSATMRYERDLDYHPTKRMGTAEEVAKVVTFLASPAASWVNGTNVRVDGAFTRGVNSDRPGPATASTPHGSRKSGAGDIGQRD